MYSTPVFVITFVLLCDIRVIISKPLAETQQTLYLVRQDENLNIEGLSLPSKPSDIHSKDSQNFDKIIAIQKPIVISSEAAKETLNDIIPDRYLNSDTKKQYYLIKINEYYDFLPLQRNEDNAYLRLEIIDGDDMGYARRADERSDQHLVKRDLGQFPAVDEDNDVKVLGKRDLSKTREISDETLKSFLNVLQTNFVKKRDIHDFRNDRNDEYAKLLVKRDLGNFLESETSQLSADPDDPQNNNYRYIAYVPFFKVQKYYLNRKLLDVL